MQRCTIDNRSRQPGGGCVIFDHHADDVLSCVRAGHIRGGLRVRAVHVVVKSAKDRLDEQTKGDVAKIREYLETHLFFRTQVQIRTALGVRADRVSAAIGAMITSGELIEDGTQRCPNYHLSGVKPNGA